MNKYSKFVVAIVGGLISVALTIWGDSPPEWLVTVIPVLTALGVYQVPNK